MLILELLKALVLGIIEGITEWLPVSSTGHLLLFNEFFPLNQDTSFTHMLVEVIQLAAIVAVVVYFFGRLNPFSKKKSAEHVAPLGNDTCSSSSRRCCRCGNEAS